MCPFLTYLLPVQPVIASAILWCKALNAFKLTSVILKTFVTDKALLSSHISTPDNSYPSSFRDRTGCGMYCWFNLWPHAAVSLTSNLTLCFLLCQLQLSCISALSCAVWRSHLMTKSSSWSRALLSLSPALAQGRPPGSSRVMMCHTSKWTMFKTMVKATKLCKAAPQPVFWPCGTWTGSTQGCISARIGALEKLRRWLFLFQVRHVLFTCDWTVYYHMACRSCLTSKMFFLVGKLKK